MIQLLFTFLVSAHAQTEAMDLLVRESIENHFHDYGRQVDLRLLEYYGKPKIEGDMITAETSVWGERGAKDHWGDWGWYVCTTQLRETGADTYQDLGSDCYYDFD